MSNTPNTDPAALPDVGWKEAHAILEPQSTNPDRAVVAPPASEVTTQGSGEEASIYEFPNRKLPYEASEPRHEMPKGLKRAFVLGLIAVGGYLGVSFAKGQIEHVNQVNQHLSQVEQGLQRDAQLDK